MPPISFDKTTKHTHTHTTLQKYKKQKKKSSHTEKFPYFPATCLAANFPLTFAHIIQSARAMETRKQREK